MCRVFCLPLSTYLPNHFLLNLVCAVNISVPLKQARAFSKLICSLPVLKASFAYSYSRKQLSRTYLTRIICPSQHRHGKACSPRLFCFCSVRSLYARQEFDCEHTVLTSSYVSLPGLLNRFGWNLVVDVKYLAN
jgi:hypothetical protein